MLFACVLLVHVVCYRVFLCVMGLSCLSCVVPFGLFSLLFACWLFIVCLRLVYGLFIVCLLLV